MEKNTLLVIGFNYYEKQRFPQTQLLKTKKHSFEIPE